MIRGIFLGSFWGLLVGGLVVVFASLSDDGFWDERQRPVADLQGAAGTEPVVMSSFDDVLAAPQPDAAPVAPVTTAAPVIYPWVASLPMTAGQPMLPLIDGKSALVPASEDALQSGVSAPEPPEPEGLPEIDVQEARVPEVSLAPQEPPLEDILQTGDATEDAPEVPTSTVRINRPGAEGEVADTFGDSAEAVTDETVDPDAPALQRYAASFDNPLDQPVLGILLRDDPSAAPPVAELADLGFAPTVIVNALAPDARARMQAYREAGAEVALELALPDGALPSDVEVAFEAAIALLPQAALFYSPAGDVVQGNVQVTAQVMSVLADRGMGFVAQQQGLGNAVRVAGQSGVAAAEVMRDLDDSDAGTGAMARALDQSAFRARQSGDAVLMAPASPATLAVLSRWARDNGNSGTAIGPVSGVLIDLQE